MWPLINNSRSWLEYELPYRPHEGPFKTSVRAQVVALVLEELVIYLTNEAAVSRRAQTTAGLVIRRFSFKAAAAI